MTEIRCGHCSAGFVVPESYAEPYIKCPECGTHNKTPGQAPEPKYKILDQAGRQRASKPASTASPASVPVEPLPPQPLKTGGARLAQPALASAEQKAAAATTRIDHQISARPVDERKILEDALGKPGMEMVLQLVSGYMGELSEARRRAEKTRVMQTLMRSKFSAELSARAVEFAEKCPETQEILWNNYRSSLLRGLAIFFTGVLISAGVHLVAHPGRELVLFQLPFAVGFAFAVNAAINMAGLKFPALRTNLVHYGFLGLAIILIAGYIVWGVLF